MQKRRTIQLRLGFWLVLLGLCLSSLTIHAQSIPNKPDAQQSLNPSNLINGTWDTSLHNSLAIPGTISNLHLDANNRLYMAGNFNYLNGELVNGLASWDGTSWQGYGLQANDVDTINAVFCWRFFAERQSISVDLLEWRG
ncbi:hypothetical protein [Herpetosiphon sp. NSE202]|uniref:hypothetical protein n=1 Tax=Herpetosiphon sp. NSE202 TaxID=3351349 RepID=UPI00363440A3